MAAVPADLPTDVQRRSVETALDVLGIPKDGLRSVHFGVTTITCRYLHREASRAESRGHVEAEVVIPIRGET